MRRAWGISSWIGGHGGSCRLQRFGRFGNVVVGYQLADDHDHLRQARRRRHPHDSPRPQRQPRTTATDATTVPTEAQVKSDYLTALRRLLGLSAGTDDVRSHNIHRLGRSCAGCLDEDGWRPRERGSVVGPDDPGYVVVESVKLSGPTTAVVSSCWWDTGVLYGPPADCWWRSSRRQQSAGHLTVRHDHGTRGWKVAHVRGEAD